MSDTEAEWHIKRHAILTAAQAVMPRSQADYLAGRFGWSGLDFIVRNLVPLAEKQPV